MITLSTDWLRDRWPELVSAGAVPLRLSRWDGGDAFTLADLGVLPSAEQVVGAVVLGADAGQDVPVVIRLALATGTTDTRLLSTFSAPDGKTYVASGSCEAPHPARDMPVQLVDVAGALAERRAALIESSLLRDTSISVIGLGTGGVHVALELAKAGVGRFLLMDAGRLDVGNVARHHAGISHAGRRKVHVARDLILEKNPAADVVVYPLAASLESEDLVREVLERSNVVICATDSRPSKLFINRLAVAAGKSAIYGGAFRRAYGGQVLRVRAHQSPCYQCFVMSMPEEDADREVASVEDAAEIAYSDRPVPIEPGLALDVAPIALMTAKLALNELILGRDTELGMLERDLAAPWYLWINRPEPGTQYASCPPLSESCDEQMTILRWYGVHLDADPGRPVCGDFAAAVREAYGLDVGLSPELPARPPSLDASS
jgi:molybdopterin/thiamine biosynthesis adenylyltransferase